mmetsp:Transcript_16226/g.52804  ORF Transcript_16226/g.52804 Transcript_16226/m.52804 type:complete len:238 (+) Transcript_16226:154-867(+)
MRGIQQDVDLQETGRPHVADQVRHRLVGLEDPGFCQHLLRRLRRCHDRRLRNRPGPLHESGANRGVRPGLRLFVHPRRRHDYGHKPQRHGHRRLRNLRVGLQRDDPRLQAAPLQARTLPPQIRRRLDASGRRRDDGHGRLKSYLPQRRPLGLRIRLRHLRRRPRGSRGRRPHRRGLRPRRRHFNGPGHLPQRRDRPRTAPGRLHDRPRLLLHREELHRHRRITNRRRDVGVQAADGV